MTTPEAGDDRNSRDPRFDAAWRAVSGEEPSQELDAAIRAAARREAGARPRQSHARDAIPSRRHWWPLAAAAAVGALTIGLLQLVTPDQLGAPADIAATDMPSPAARSAQETAAITRRDVVAQEAPEAGAADKRTGTPRDELAKDLAEADTLGKRTIASRDDGAKRAADAGVPGDRAERTRQAPAVSAPAPSDEKPGLSKTAGLPEPFPAAPQERAPAPVAPPKTAAAPSPSGNVAVTTIPMESPPSRPQAASGLRAERADAAANATTAKDAATTAQASAPETLAATHDVPARAAARPSPVAASGAGAPVEKRASDALPIDEWIALIRRLRAEGRIDVAAKELRAFRTAHANHERLLPPDLRDWRPPEK